MTETLTRPADTSGHVWPSSTPDGTAVVFTVTDHAQPEARTYAAVYSLARRSWQRVLDGADAVRASIPGYLVAQRGDRIVAAPLDRSGVSALSLPVTVDDSTGMPLRAGPRFAASTAGHFVRVNEPAGVLLVTLDWLTELRRRAPPPPPPLPR